MFYRKNGLVFFVVSIFVFIASLCLFINSLSIYANTVERVKEIRQKEMHGIKKYGKLHVEGATLTSATGETAVLRGASSHGINWYPRYLNGDAMRTMSAQGANLQRIAMYTEGDSGYIKNPVQNLNYMYIGIESALAADMYAIVDWHILEDNNPLYYVKEAETFFREVSAHYPDHPGIIYEICNEPNGDTSWEDIKQYANRIIPIIREHSPNALILVGTPNYCTDFEGPMKDPLSYPNIMYTLHRYIDVSEQNPSNISIIKEIVEAEVPVFVSEWGTSLKEQEHFSQSNFSDDTATYQENARPFLEYMEAHNISWAAWSLCNKKEAHSMIRSDCHKYSGWEEGDLSDFGKLIFTELKKNKNKER